MGNILSSRSGLRLCRGLLPITLCRGFRRNLSLAGCLNLGMGKCLFSQSFRFGVGCNASWCFRLTLAFFGDGECVVLSLYAG